MSSGGLQAASSVCRRAQSIFASLVQREVVRSTGGIVSASRNNPSVGLRRQLPLHRGAENASGKRRTCVMERKHNQDIVPLAKELRKNMTKEERHLWYDYLRDYPVRFCRQKVLGKLIADFYCARAKLVVELDGQYHREEETVRKDAERTAFLNSYDLLVCRVPNREIHRNFKSVCERIDALVQQRLKNNPSVG